MTIENLKQIAIRYATTKGSRVPLAPDELCNAVVQYMNSFFGVMTDINTIKVAVTENSGNIVFTITGNTYDGKPITPIVITVDHNDFVTDQEFEEFKTTTNAAIQKNTESINSLSFRVEDTENDITTIQVKVGQINTRVGNTETDVRNLKNRVYNTETNIAEINSTLLNKVDKVTSTGDFNRLYKISDTGQQGTVNYSDEAYASTMALRDGYGRINVSKGVEQLNGANMQNIADVEAKIPDVSGFATTEDIPSYTDVGSVSYDTTNGAIIAYDGAHEIHIPLLAGENVTIDASEDNKKIVISAAGGGGAGDVTDQEFEEFKTTTNAAIQKNTESINSLSFRVEDTENDITTIQVKVGQINTRVGNTETDVRNLKNRVYNTETNIAEINSTLLNKVDKVTSTGDFNRLYKISDTGQQGTVNYSDEAYASTMALRDGYGRINVSKGVEQLNGANMQNIADVEAKIPDVSGFATTEDIPSYTDVGSVSYDTTNGAIIAYDGAHEIHIPLLAGENVTIDASEDNKKIVISAAGGGGAGDVTAAGNNIFTGENEFRNYTYDTSYFCFVDTKEDYLTNGYTTTIKNGGFDISYYENGEGKYWTTYADNQIINKDIDMEGEVVIKFPKKEGTFALTSDVPNSDTLAKLGADNTYTGTNTFNNSIYAKNGIVAGDTTNYGANSVTKGSNTYSFPNKSGTFAMANDIINESIYFISFYANAPSEPCHLIGTIMSKNSYGTGQKTNEEFAVMLADNFYTNSNEGLAAYGRLANKDILCIYSEDGLSIRCLDEENSEIDLPTVMFFVMETEL